MWHQLLRSRIDATQNAEDELQEYRTFEQTRIAVERDGLNMSSIVAFKLEAGPLLAQTGKDCLDVSERVLEDEITGGLEEFWFPVMQPFRRSPAIVNNPNSSSPC